MVMNVYAQFGHEPIINAAGTSTRVGGPARIGLQQGARGLGTGLDYFPQGTCTSDELVALGRVVAP